MNELLPLFFVPTTSTLQEVSSDSSSCAQGFTYLKGVGSFRLRILLGLLT